VRARYYVLGVDGRPVGVDDVEVWRQWMQTAARTVAVDATPDGRVSTVFLGLDHGWDDGAPVLWETMIFGGSCDGWQWRHRSVEDARAGHAIALELARR